jgi:hypothetical protein
MQDNFLDFIDNSYSPELSNDLKDSLTIFASYNLEDHALPLTNLLYGHSHLIEVDELKDRFVNIIRSFLIELGKSFTLVFNETASIPDMNTVFNSLLDIEHYLDHDAILRVLELDEIEMEILAALFEHVNNIPTSWTFNVLDSFDKALLVKIKETHTKDTVIDQSKEEDKVESKANQVINLRLYRKFINNDNLVCFKLIRRGNVIGLPFKEYVQYIANHLEYAKDEDLANELIGILYMGCDTYNDPILGFREHSEFLFDDLGKISKIDTLLTNTFNKFSTFKLTNKVVE